MESLIEYMYMYFHLKDKMSNLLQNGTNTLDRNLKIIRFPVLSVVM